MAVADSGRPQPMENQLEHSSGSRPGRRLRYLIDIIVLAAAIVAIERAIGFLTIPAGLPAQVMFDVVTRVPEIAVVWLLLRLRGETVVDIGLKWPRSWSQAVLIGFLAGAVVFAVIYISEKAGYHRDLSAFNAVKGNLTLTVYGVFYSFFGAGFYEEFMFRGFLLHGLAMLFGASRAAWNVAVVVQGALFGMAHAYQNPLGIAITGTLGILMGFLFLASGRNLWPVIIGHGLYDASRFILFYFQGPPGG
jgi:membrane protease YdiL (CAAX protease family)